MMAKFIIFSALIGILLLGLATIGLVFLNWSDKVWNPLLSLLFVGTITTFVTVLVILKESKEEAAFTTSIVVDEDEHLPLFVFPQPQNLELSLRLSDLATLSRPVIQDGDKTVMTVSRPTNHEETVRFCGELLQYKAILLIKEILSTVWSSSQTTRADGTISVNSKVFIQKKPSDLTNVPGQQLWPTVKKNRFSEGLMQQVHWGMEVSFYPLPRGTSLSISHLPPSEKTGVEKHIVVLEKPYFFTIKIIIEPIGVASLSSLPEGLGIAPEKAKRCRTYIYAVKLEAKFEKYTAGNWRTEEYKNWVKWMFTEIQERLSY
jgi:hypothetical protein